MTKLYFFFRLSRLIFRHLVVLGGPFNTLSKSLPARLITIRGRTGRPGYTSGMTCPPWKWLWLKIANLFGDGLSNYVQVIMVPEIPSYPRIIFHYFREKTTSSTTLTSDQKWISIFFSYFLPKLWIETHQCPLVFGYCQLKKKELLAKLSKFTKW